MSMHVCFYIKVDSLTFLGSDCIFAFQASAGFECDVCHCQVWHCVVSFELSLEVF